MKIEDQSLNKVIAMKYKANYSGNVSLNFHLIIKQAFKDCDMKPY
jgi:hypothetical protein